MVPEETLFSKNFSLPTLENDTKIISNFEASEVQSETKCSQGVWTTTGISP